MYLLLMKNLNLLGKEKKIGEQNKLDSVWVGVALSNLQLLQMDS